MAEGHGDGFVWRPDAATRQRAHLTQFMHEHGIADFDELHQRSVSDVSWFTDALLNYLDVRFHQPYSSVLELSRGIAWPEWCVGGRLNIVDSCLDKHIESGSGQALALIWEGEDGRTAQLSYAELAQQVNQAANGLRSLGLGAGDAVGLFMPLTPAQVVALLAVVKIGAVVLPLFSGYGAGAVASRLRDADAKALVTADGTRRNGKLVPMKPIADLAADESPTVAHVLVLRHAGNEVPFNPERDREWDALLAGQSSEAESADTAAEDPLMIIYTSGTTGRPKGAVHTHCGFPVKAAQDMAFGMDVHPGDRIFWITDMGWMMGPWLVFGSLLLGACMFVYDGAPMHPEPDRIWRMVAEHQVSQLGLSPTYVRALMPHGIDQIRQHDFSRLRSVGSTGEPWNPGPWQWLFQDVLDRQRPIINYSGGTEISGGIVMGNPLKPLKPTAFAAPCPGIEADVVDAAGKSITGDVGELVIRTPWIGMTRGFWRDPDRYLETYWSRWPDVWVHGDWARRDEDGSWYILGRSDDTLKIAGKRLGPAEVESILVQHPAVVEAAAIGVPDPIKGSALVVFCVIGDDQSPDDPLAAALGQWTTDQLGKPLAPKAVLFVDDLPKTRNAKVMRRMLRSAYLGQDPGDTSALVNPDSLSQVRAASSG